MTKKPNLNDVIKDSSLPSEISGIIKKVVTISTIGFIILYIVIAIYPQLLIYLIMAGMSAGSFFAARFYSAKYKKLEDTPTSRIRSAAQGYVELEGHFENIKPRREVAPLSGVAAQFWKLCIERTKKTGRRKSTIVTEAVVKSDDSPFLQFNDGTGKSYVLMNEATILGVRKHGSTLSGSILDILPIKAKERLEKLSNLTIWEEYLPSDQPVRVKGQLVTLRTNQSPFIKIDTCGMSPELSRYIDDGANANTATVNKKWFSEMKRIEGISQDGELQGLEQVNVITSGIDMSDQDTLVVTCFDNATLSRAWRRFMIFYYTISLVISFSLIFIFHGKLFPMANQDLINSVLAVFGMASRT